MHKYVALVFVLSAYLLLPGVSYAATLYMNPSDVELKRGDTLAVSVRLDTDEDECVNVVDAVITYPASIEPVDISRGNSIFSMWVEEPIINKKDGTITFAGGIPNGYCGRVDGDPRLTNVLAEIVFRSPSFSIGSNNTDGAGVVGEVAFSDATTVYLNDGRGTVASLNTYPAEILLEEGVGPTMRNDWRDAVIADNVKPEEFSISLQKDERAFSQDYYIVFNTTDKQTGIDQYQVIEEPLSQFGAFQWGGADAPWLIARSPYVLEDQSLNSTIRVKAIDKAGNEYIATLVPDRSLRTTSALTYALYALSASIVVLLLVGGFFIVQFLKKRNMKKQQNQSEISDAEDDNETEYE